MKNGGPYSKWFTIVKFRGGKDATRKYIPTMMFVRGVGVVVKTTHVNALNGENSFDPVFDKAIKIARSQSTEGHVICEPEEIKKNWNYDFSPKEVLELIFKTYRIGA